MYIALRAPFRIYVLIN